MVKSRGREKLINVAIYFATNTRSCGKIKLIKLLYLLDFEHYRQTGASVTGLEYHAMKMGPVPMDLYQEWDALEPDFAEAIEIVPEQVIDFIRESVRPKRDFDDRHFTPRELRLMANLAERFRDDLTRLMINVTHQERGPWAAIWDNGHGNLDRIPYLLAVRDTDSHAEIVREAASEREAIRLAHVRWHRAARVGWIYRDAHFYLDPDTDYLKPKYFPGTRSAVGRRQRHPAAHQPLFEACAQKLRRASTVTPYPGFFLGIPANSLSQKTWLDLRNISDLDPWNFDRYAGRDGSAK